MPRFHARRLLPFALLLAGLAVLYFPLLAGQILFQRDIGRQIFPARWFLRDAFVRGDSLLWNPLQGLGLSTLANPLNQLTYPLNAVFFISSSPQLISWWLLLHLVNRWGRDHAAGPRAGGPISRGRAHRWNRLVFFRALHRGIHRGASAWWRAPTCRGADWGSFTWAACCALIWPLGRRLWLGPRFPSPLPC